MAVLKKIRASSLNEVLVATIIIILVFGIAMAILTNLMRGLAMKETHEQHTVLNELVYQYENDKVKVPYNSSDGKFSYAVFLENENGMNWLNFEITSKRTNKVVVKKIIVNEKD
ncbi:hypothetical protein [Tenacibaculum jejuense]|uniref:Type II secretion system protein n=1 Tax=Tenacibaculum jejuense TaxID=584609 RepID=A0A238UAL3_9FLAO|nr:hypothetical protein [Tenacibaculum jejuense]SNR15450.1 conserved protein of unknown function [Tenacibaculum jejuense]